MINSLRKKIFYVTTMLLLSAMPNGSIAAITIDKIVAVVNNEVITQSELDEILQRPRREINEKFDGEEEQQLLNKLTRELLNRLIEKRLQLQVARQKNITVGKEDVEAALNDIKLKNAFIDDEAFKRALAQEGMTLEQYKKELEDQLTIMKLLTREVRANIVISEEEIKDYYKNNEKQYALPEEAHLRIMLFKESDDAGMKKAADILSEIKNGANFADLAKKHSDDPTAKDGGDIGFIKKGQMFPELEKAAFSLKKNDVSDIIKTPSSYYIIKVEDRKEAAPIPLEKVRSDIEKALYEKKADFIYDQWLSDLRKNSYVEIKLQ
ncbi:MAG: peptidylprolyl isomerase [Nitrospirota bacterium]